MGWPKGKPRGPRKPAVKVEPISEAPAPAEPEVQKYKGPQVSHGYKIMHCRVPGFFEFFYNGNSFKVHEGKPRMLPAPIAYHGMKKAVISWDPVTDRMVRALGIEGESDCSLLPPDTLKRIEFIDRSSMSGGRDATTGLPTHPEVVAVPGAGLESTRRVISGHSPSFSGSEEFSG